MIRVCDYVMEKIAEAGVRHVFQVTGRGSLFLSDALAKNTYLAPISLHHEQACSFAAIAYAEQTEKVGVALVSTGCASTNTLTGVLSAWQDGVPCIFISGQHVLSETTRHTGLALRTFGQQEADIVKLVSPITKFAHMVTSAEEIVNIMEMAITAATSGRKGPVWIDIPLDLQSSMIEPNVLNAKSLKVNLPTASEKDVKEFIRLLKLAERPAILIGKGVRFSKAEKEIREFSQKWEIPVTYAASAPDIFGSSNEMSIGSVGAMGCSRAGNFVVANSDFLIVLGSRLNSLTTGVDFCKFARHAKVYVIDIDKTEHEKQTINIYKLIQTDIKCFLKSILKYQQKRSSLDWKTKCYHWKSMFGKVEKTFQSRKEIDLYQLSDSLSRLVPTPSSIITDSGLIEVILPSNVVFKDGIKCIHPASQGTMGFALPAAIGAQFADSSPVFAVVGDGSIMMNLQELESIRFHQLPLKIFVINNNAYSIIRRRQKDLFRTRTVGTDPSNGISCPDFSKVAKCFGLNFLKIRSVDNLDDGIKKVIELNGPVLCEIIGREDQSYIETGITKSVSSRKIVRRPLEDQKPFLDRELFISEMIVEPIDQ